MKRNQGLLAALAVMLTASITTTLTLAQGPTGTGPALAPLASAGTAFTYQGQLRNGGSPVNGACDFQFGLWNSASLGSQVGMTVTVPSLSVTNGLFTAPIDFGANAFNGDARYLGIAVACPGGGIYTAFDSRQALTPAPMALALPGLHTQQNTYSASVIGGYSGNVISVTVEGGTIGGGGVSGHPNRVWASYASVGGGLDNTASGFDATVGGGAYNTASGVNSTVGGGLGNTASGVEAAVGGGAYNTASGVDATVGGGVYNIASGEFATVGGGNSNTASGQFAMVPGGNWNSATMSYTLAAGRYARANHVGAFVWGDSMASNFASTANDQFLVRASGGVGINTNAPAMSGEMDHGSQAKASTSCRRRTVTWTSPSPTSRPRLPRRDTANR